jgi:hypothetical protein
LLLVGYFAGIDAARGIAWRAATRWRTRAFSGVRQAELRTGGSLLSARGWTGLCARATNLYSVPALVDRITDGAHLVETDSESFRRTLDN